MAVKKNILITVFAIIILGLAIHPVLANDAAEEKAATEEKVPKQLKQGKQPKVSSNSKHIAV